MRSQPRRCAGCGFEHLPRAPWHTLCPPCWRQRKSREPADGGALALRVQVMDLQAENFRLRAEVVALRSAAFLAELRDGRP